MTKDGVFASSAKRSMLQLAIDFNLRQSEGATLTLIPREVPSLKLRLLDLEELGNRNSFASLLRDGECEVRVWFANTGLSAIDRRVDLKSDVEELTGEEVCPVIHAKAPWSALCCDERLITVRLERVTIHHILVRGEDTAEIRATTQTLVSLRSCAGDHSRSCENVRQSLHDLC